MKGIQDRHVVNGDHTKGSFDATGFQESGDQFAHGDGHSRFVHVVLLSLVLA